MIWTLDALNMLKIVHEKLMLISIMLMQLLSWNLFITWFKYDKWESIFYNLKLLCNLAPPPPQSAQYWALTMLSLDQWSGFCLVIKLISSKIILNFSMAIVTNKHLGVENGSLIEFGATTLSFVDDTTWFQLIACPHLLAWATNERLLPTWVSFSSSLTSDSHWM